MKNIIFLFCLLMLCNLQAQETEPIQADRPDQTETPAIVPAGMFQVEAGFSYQKEKPKQTSYTLPSVLLKYGVNENFELRVITEFNYEKINNTNQSGFSSVLVGFKSKLCSENGIIPKTSFIAHIGLPNFASTKYKTDYFAPQFRFTMQHTLSKKLSLSYNLGSEWNGFTAEPIFLYTLTTGYSITEKLGSYIELFGFAPQNTQSNHNCDGGITYLINNNFMLDLSSGIGLTQTAPNFYMAFGFSFRI